MIRALDVDGVFADFNNGYRDLIREEFGLPVPAISDSFPDTWDWAPLDPDARRRAWKIIEEGEFWRELAPLPDAVEGLERAYYEQIQGDPVYFITDRPGKWAKQLTEDWLEHWGFPRPTVLIASQKGLVCNGLKVDLFLDDRPENCWDAALHHPKRQVLLLDKPYNRYVFETGVRNITRITSILDARVLPSLPVAA